MGLGPKGHPTFMEGRRPTPSKVGFPQREPAQLGLVPSPLSIFRTDTLFGSYFFEQTCLFVETLPSIFILPFFPFFT